METGGNIKISRNGTRTTSISVLIPTWNKRSDHGNLLVILPSLGIETIARDEKDAKIAIEEAITSFCIAAERFGQGVEKELQALGWEHVGNETDEPVLGYSGSNTDAIIDRLIQTGENYINPHLQIA